MESILFSFLYLIVNEVFYITNLYFLGIRHEARLNNLKSRGNKDWQLFNSRNQQDSIVQREL